MLMADVLIETFAPMRERAAELRSDPNQLAEILAAGREAAQKVARETMGEVREAIGLWQTSNRPVTA
jgi:tryptophanyl-tRNA synthetase